MTHTAVLTYEFLLAPALCEPEEIDFRIADLAEYARSVQVHEESPLVEEDAVGRLHDIGSYPCDSLFKSNLAKLEDYPYTVKDISRIVTSILASADCFSYAEERLWEKDKITLDPPFVGLNPKRTEQIEKLIEDVAVCNELENLNYSILHFCKKNTFTQTQVNVELRNIYPPIAAQLPLIFQRSIKLHLNYRTYLASICLKQGLQGAPENLELMKEFFYWAALCELKNQALPLANINPSKFEIGHAFIASLKINQCLPGQKFWSACLSSIIAVLIDDDSYEVNPFRKSAKSDEQRVSGDFLAYRCHVTKSTVALRLMFWRDNNGFIIFSNVGPKNEEKIVDPD
jgi:hypothetical protein